MAAFQFGCRQYWTDGDLLVDLNRNESLVVGAEWYSHVLKCKILDSCPADAGSLALADMPSKTRKRITNDVDSVL